MADEVNETPVDSAEAEAAKKQAFPASVQVSNAPVERAEYLQLVDSNKDLVKSYGEASFESFMTKVGSDGSFAQRVVTNLITGEKGQNLGLHPDAPQENNLTGRVDRMVDIAVRLPVNA